MDPKLMSCEGRKSPYLNCEEFWGGGKNIVSFVLLCEAFTPGLWNQQWKFYNKGDKYETTQTNIIHDTIWKSCPQKDRKKCRKEIIQISQL